MVNGAESSVMHGEHWRKRPVLDGDLENFRNNGLAAGFDNALRLHEDAPEVIISEGLLHVLYATFRSVMGEEFFDTYYTSGVGNPEGPMVQGYCLTLSDLYAVRNAWQLARFIDSPKRIVEVGPGYGALAAILRRLYPDAEIVLVDLPEHHKVLEYYLSEMEVDVEVTTELPDGADVFIALRCLMEMPPDEVRKYLHWAQETDVHWCYIVNRYLKCNVLKYYPFDRRWQPIISANDYVTGQIHELLLERDEEESDLLQATLDCLPPYNMDGNMMIWFKGEMQVVKAWPSTPTPA
jgi:hypothetical protein